MGTSDRKPIGKKQRFEIFKRDAFTCQYCGARPPNAILHVDHVIAVANGGGNDSGNLVTACQSCNHGKGARPLDVVPEPICDVAKRAKEARAQMEAYAQFLQEERDAVEDWAWSVAEVLQPGASEGYSASRFASIKMFVRRLGYAQTMDAANITADRNFSGLREFKFFCGVCWRKLRESGE